MAQSNSFHLAAVERNTTIARLKDELAKVNAEVEACTKLNVKYKRAPQSTDMPQVRICVLLIFIC